jgi:creatinine amidohydrolase
MKSQVEVSNMSWTEYAEIVETNDPAILVPVGAIEQHGPHLPLATDCLIPTTICKEVASRTANLVAPAITYGYKSIPRCGGGQHFPGTTSLDANTLIQQIKDLVREFARHKIRKIAFIVGHLENQWFVIEACDLALREVKMLGMPAPRLMSVGYWEFLSRQTIARVFGSEFPDWSLEHAGIMETSVMLHCHPELVHLERLTDQQPAKVLPYDLWPYDPASVPASGILNTAKGATAEKGAIFYDEYVGSLSQALSEAFGR